MAIDIFKLATECPGLTITIKADDLIAANARLIEETKRELEQLIIRKDGVSYLTKDEVMAKLSIAPTTLWRWQKCGYLVPINVGGQRRYKSTDLDEILEGRK